MNKFEIQNPKSEIILAEQLPLMEHYYTIQGEGYNTGTPAYFLRLGGCDVGCVWCDVKDSWNAEKHPLSRIEEMVELVHNANASTAVITGGDPMMSDLTYLTDIFHQINISFWCVTSGAYLYTGSGVSICVY